jgi:hypothetical protein
MYRYITNCISARARDIEAMTDCAREITYDTLIKHVGIKEVSSVYPFDQYDWGSGKQNALRLKGDFMVAYWKSTYRGKPCYYIEHSRIEYIFVQDN